MGGVGQGAQGCSLNNYSPRPKGDIVTRSLPLSEKDTLWGGAKKRLWLPPPTITAAPWKHGVTRKKGRIKKDFD